MLGGCNGEVGNGGDSMTVVTYKNYGERTAELYNITIYNEQGGILWQGEAKFFTIESSVDAGNIEGGEGEYSGVKDVRVTKDGVTVSYEKPDDEDWRDYLDYLRS